MIIGGRGADVIIGGRGKDQFIYKSIGESTPDQPDVVTWKEMDRFDFSGIDANSQIKGKQSFVWIAGKSFSGQIGELRTTETRIEADLNGDKIVDFEIHLQSKALLQRENLLF